MSEPTISVVIPLYNKEREIGDTLRSVLAQTLQPTEIVVVDDGSTKDDTAAKADAWAERHPGIIKAVHQENGGHGQAVNTGLANARGATSRWWIPTTGSTRPPCAASSGSSSEEQSRTP